MKKYTIYLDFDGTCVEHEYPKIGRMNFGFENVLIKLMNAGCKIILNTYRSNLEAEHNNGCLNAALQFLNDNVRFELPYEIKECLLTKAHPRQWDWEVMNKNLEIFIDDIALNIPLKPAVTTNGNVVDWNELDKQFKENKIY